MKREAVTTKCEVFSFGVVLWEILMLGETPYSTLTNAQVIESVTQKGGQLEPPFKYFKETPFTQGVYALIKKCCDLEPKNRPSFAEIQSELHKLGSVTEPVYNT